jgi:diaminohydroxyphosphoribosylaminopyrimidine deaminase/5-amino-6-(5-phosphoribosylamino)uracil reductase
MGRALELAARGQGSVEPNPMVGCVIARDDVLIAEGWHQRFGGPHAEIEALKIAKDAAREATLYVTLEPCCHTGKTPPCVDAIIPAGFRRVVIAETDPFPMVSGKGIDQLRQAKVNVSVGLRSVEAHELNAPFHKRIQTGLPWVIAKWAMTLDGRIATRTGDSRWISSDASRAIVHRIRGRVDAIIVGRGTVAADDPLLTARPPGPRIPARVVLDAMGELSSQSRLVQSAKDAPVIVVTSMAVSQEDRSRLVAAGCEVLSLDGATWSQRLPRLLQELGKRQMTNVLVEGGSQVLGGFVDLGLIDELHTFINPRVVGGVAAIAPVGGQGVERLAEAMNLDRGTWEEVDGDLYWHGRVKSIMGNSPRYP